MVTIQIMQDLFLWIMHDVGFSMCVCDCACVHDLYASPGESHKLSHIPGLRDKETICLKVYK